MTLKRWGVAVVLAGLSGVASAAFTSTLVEQGVTVDLRSPLYDFPRPDFPYQQLSVETSGLTWDCSSGACALGDGARLNVVMSSPEGVRAVQGEELRAPLSLSVVATVQGLSVLDPLGAQWTLLPDLAAWRYGVHITENQQPDDAQFMVSYGSLQLTPPGLQAGPAQDRITDQTGWVEAGPTVPVGSVWPVAGQDAALAWLFFGGSTQPQSIAPVYALPSLSSSCMSITCMRFERGTLMIDAHRLSFDVQAVAAVPEPGTWATMALGLLGLGAVTHRRRAH